MTQLGYELQGIIQNKIHLAKCKVKPELSKEQWAQLDNQKIAEEAMAEIIPHLEFWMYLPCCHVTGMHDPQHYEERTYICEIQKTKAFERFAKDLGVNPVVRMEPGCGWCRNYPHMRAGEGVRLFESSSDQRKPSDV